MEFIKNTGHPYIWGKNDIVKWLAVLLLEILIAGIAIISPLPLFFFAVAGVVVLILLVKPEYSFYTVIFFIIPGRQVTLSLFGITEYISHLLVIIVLFFWGITKLVKTKEVSTATGPACTQSLLFFLAWALLSLTWSHNRTVGLEDAVKLSTAVALVFMITAFVRDPKTFRIAVGIFIFVAIIDGTMAVIYPYTDFWMRKVWTFFGSLNVVFGFWGKHKTRGFGGRCMGLAPAHSTAVTLSFALTFCMMFFLVTRSRKKRLFFLGLAGILFAVITGTLTKSIIASVLISMIYVVLHLRPLRKRFFTAVFIIFVLVIVFFVLTRFQDVGKSLYVIGQNMKAQSDTLDKTSIGQRIEMAKIGLQELWKTGGMGTGIGGFLQYTHYDKMDGSHPAILWELGFIGMLLWIWILAGSYRFFVDAIKKSDNEYYRRMLLVYLGGYINILISWLVTFAYADIYIWFYLGIGFALVNLSRTDRLERKAIMLPFPDKGESLVVI
ncbi:MAG: hypothetical protein DRH37_04925 [Deltaproteobacteria bacterium]|nr:MAG: hypothetical protein DRH37_04925 [Deltaproteobacteria bacterium]